MRNLRVTVNNAADQTEARNIMISLGYLPKEITCISGGDLGFVVNAYNENGATYKEINLPELRDLVVLKRNDRNDRTHTDQDNWSWFISSNGAGYVFGAGNANGLHQWDESSLNMVDLKPIEKKEMKEYLDKQQDGTYKLIKADGGCIDRDWNEIPEGAIKAYLNNSKTINFINANDDYMNTATNGEWIDTHRGKHEACGHELIWQRAKHPEELPFIDDEPKITTAKGSELDYIAKIHDMRDRYDGESDEDYRYQLEHYISRKEPSLNDQYAEIEKVRQSAWQKQEGGSHYKNLKIQPMQYALENKLDYAQANVVKYVTRHKEKNGKEDLLKAIHNLELMIEFYYGDEK